MSCNLATVRWYILSEAIESSHCLVANWKIYIYFNNTFSSCLEAKEFMLYVNNNENGWHNAVVTEH